MLRRRQRQKGDALIEFTLVGIPLTFVLISIFEISRGMWIYHSLEYAITEGTRYASFHGENCSMPPNACAKNLSDVAAVIQYVGVGLLPDRLTLTFTSQGGTFSCVLKDCLTETTTMWPPANGNLRGTDVTITATYPFSSAIALFWPGAGPGVVFPSINLPATSTERIQF
jgi:hypothetical protein